MKSTLGTLAAAALAALTAFAATAQDLPQVRAAVLESGTVNWELDTIIRNGLDAAEGFELVVTPFADNGATRVAVEGGVADVMVADWIWGAMQRAEGRDYVFLPYSKAVGAIVVRADSPLNSLADLAGGSIGIAGGPLDKSWLILRAYAEQEHGTDLAAETEQVFGAPPLIMMAAQSGEVDAAINFWHFLAKMKAGGMRELVSVADASQELGLDPDTPLLGYMMKESFVEADPDLVRRFYAATRAAKALLASDDAAWEPLRERMNAANEAEFLALRDDYRAGIPAAGPVDMAGAGAMLALMADLGGEELVGRATTIPDGLFLDVE
jgi:NitT/TauT family transport system substrate-binding protein